MSSIDQRYVETLENENWMLREKVAELEGILGMRVEVPLMIGLSASEAKIIGILTKREMVTKAQMLQMLYISRSGGEEVEAKIVDVFVCKARAKLNKFDITIETVWGRGYRLNPENKAKIAALLRAENGITDIPEVLQRKIP